MESAGLRKRNSSQTTPTELQSMEAPSVQQSSRIGETSQAPRFTIDLSLPPRQRYHGLAQAFRPQLRGLPVLFDMIVQDMHLSVKFARRLAKLCLRKVHSWEETEELRGVSETIGVEFYMIVAFNVLLDTFMVCYL